MLSIELANNGAVDVAVDLTGTLADKSATCSGTGDMYREALACPARETCHFDIPSLHPGMWVHRIKVTDTDQRQAQRRAIAASSSGDPVNRVHWTVYAEDQVQVVGAAGGLAAKLDALSDPSAGELGGLVLFSRPEFACASNPTPMMLGRIQNSRCPGADAAYCLGGSNIVVDALDVNGEPGAVILSAAEDINAPLLRVRGSNNVLKGLELHGNPKPDRISVRDTLFIDGNASHNSFTDLIVLGPGSGDAVSAQDTGRDNILARSRVTGAQDKGVKVSDSGALTVVDSCISGNLSGGIQATLHGDATALRNVVQLNLPGDGKAPQTGIIVTGSPSEDPSSVRTDGNIVRFNGNKGLVATDNAVAEFRNDYVALNQYAGARVEATDVCAGAGPDVRFEGVSFVCNAIVGDQDTCRDPETLGEPCQVGDPACKKCRPTPGLSGTCNGTTACALTGDPMPACSTCTGKEPTGLGLGVEHTSCASGIVPTVHIENGNNAFMANLRVSAPDAGNLVVDDGISLDAQGNFWAPPPSSETVKGSSVTTQPTAGPQHGPPTIQAVWPHRPSRGDLVRIWGTGFDAVTGNPGDVTTCSRTTPPTDSCDPSNDAVTRANRKREGNQVTITMLGKEFDLDVVAVTPTMLAFLMPMDCFDADAELVVRRNDVASQSWPVCLPPPDCLGAPDGTACEPDGIPCTRDICQAQACTHVDECPSNDSSTTTSSTCTTTTSTSSSPTTVPSTTATSVTVTAPPSTTTTSPGPAGGPTTTSTTAPPTTSTTLPCATARCLLERALARQECGDVSSKRSVRSKLENAMKRVDKAIGGASSPKDCKRAKAKLKAARGTIRNKVKPLPCKLARRRGLSCRTAKAQAGSCKRALFAAAQKAETLLGTCKRSN